MKTILTSLLLSTAAFSFGANAAENLVAQCGSVTAVINIDTSKHTMNAEIRDQEKFVEISDYTNQYSVATDMTGKFVSSVLFTANNNWTATGQWVSIAWQADANNDMKAIMSDMANNKVTQCVVKSYNPF